MDLLRLLLNILWLLTGGLMMALGWALFGLVMAISIIGLPFARSCFVIAQLSLMPFGKDIASRQLVRGEADLGTGPMGVLGNVIWFLVAGIWLCLGHLFCAIALLLTIIGIPFAIQHVKLAMLTVAPIGQTVIDS
ncbi:YccF domain-containing protein [Ferrimonas gelatinilytica]|uniref:Inner membrane protein YccF n=1 Tax=Ferrimonas gelatinilytica TaxID=1255257 RepID=A0ABP9SCS8_9GAMM